MGRMEQKREGGREDGVRSRPPTPTPHKALEGGGERGILFLLRRHKTDPIAREEREGGVHRPTDR